MNVGLLQLLKNNRGNWLTMEAIAGSLESGPSVVLGEIEKLRQIGYLIEAVPAYGFRLSGCGQKFNADLIEHGLGTKRIGRKVLVYESTNSTNDVAWQYAMEGGWDGLAVFAEHQRGGRGRSQNRWVSPAGKGILCSVLLEDMSRDMGEKLTLLAGLSAAEAVEDVCSIRTRIKWPNDVSVSGKKLAGVMVESRKIDNAFTYVIGIGINCLQSRDDFEGELGNTAVSIRQLTGGDVDRLQLAERLLGRLDYWLSVVNGEVPGQQVKGLHDEWLGRCDEVGRRITLVSNGQSYTGRVVDVSVAGGLLVQLDNGAVKVFDSATTTVMRR